jgi:hypothetical protein
MVPGPPRILARLEVEISRVLGKVEGKKTPPKISCIVPGVSPLFTANDNISPRLSVTVADAVAAHPDGMLGSNAGPIPFIVINAETKHGDEQLPPMLSVVSDWKLRLPDPEYS